MIKVCFDWEYDYQASLLTTEKAEWIRVATNGDIVASIVELRSYHLRYNWYFNEKRGRVYSFEEARQRVNNLMWEDGWQILKDKYRVLT